MYTWSLRATGLTAEGHMVSVSEENISGIDTHFRKYHIGGINTFGIVSPITSNKAI